MRVVLEESERECVCLCVFCHPFPTLFSLVSVFGPLQPAPPHIPPLLFSLPSFRAGPRIFIGKLTKETSEADVKDYFSKFGYVMDVYLPKSKDNKLEHRG